MSKGRRIAWFSSGAASAVAAKITNSDIIAYCCTGAEDVDNQRFLQDCERWFGRTIEILKSEKYDSTWDVWEQRKYLAGIDGAPCTSELKRFPRELFQQPNDVHIFGYTADSGDVRRASLLRENWPELNIETPLIDAGITKAACLSLILSAGITPPRVYAMGFPNANCIPCVKATSPSYWALVRKQFPREFARMADLARGLDVKLSRLGGERIFIEEIPVDYPTTKAVAPECDLLCDLVERDLLGIAQQEAASERPKTQKPHCRPPQAGG